MLSKFFLRIVPVMWFLLIFSQCSGGVGGDEGSGGGEVSEDDLLSLSNIPDIDLDALDAALASSSNARVSSTKYSSAPTTSEFSRAACEIRSCVDEFKAEVKSFQVEKCFLEAFERYTEADVGNGEYKYYAVTMDESQFEPEDDFDDEEEGEESEEEDDDEDEEMGIMTSYVRTGVINGTLSVTLCEPDWEDGTYSQTLEMVFIVSDGKFDGTITDTWFDDDHQIHLNLASENPEEFGEDDEAILEGKFNGQWGAGHINLDITKPGGTLLNTVDASFRSGDEDAEWGTWTSTVYGTFDSQEGCSVWSASGTYPAESASNLPDDLRSEAGLDSDDQFCWVESADPEAATSFADFVEVSTDGFCNFEEGGEDNIECFWFELEADVLSYLVHDNDTATHYDEVAARGLMDFSVPEISFVQEWDCQAPNGFTDIVITPDNEEFAAAIEACIALEEGLDEGRDISSCEESEREEDTEDEFDTEFEEEESSEDEED